MLLIALKLQLETPEAFKPRVNMFTTHTQPENNGLVNQPTDLCKSNPNILMDPTQLLFMRQTVPIQTETTKPHKLRAQLSLRNNKDGNPKVTPTTGLLKPLLANKDGQMKSTHGPSNLLLDRMICQSLFKLILAWDNNKLTITRLINLLSHLKLVPPML